MGAISRIDAVIEEGSLLKHPFYRAWSEGRLRRESLAGYSKEYFQLVKAVPLLMDPVIRAAPAADRPELEANRQEEADHVGPWVDFAAGLGVPGDELAAYGGLEKTRRAVSDLGGLMGGYGAGAAAMYALEKEIPEISRTKLEGLGGFYGMGPGPATRYFELHTEADVRHAAAWRRAMAASGAAEGEMVRAAEGSVAAQNLLLDACYEEYCS